MSILLPHIALAAMGYVTITKRGRMTLFTPTKRFLDTRKEEEPLPMGTLLPFPTTYRGVQK